MLARELAWFETEDRRLLATVVIDTDGEFSAGIFARDLNERFRCVIWTPCSTEPEPVITALRSLIQKVSSDLDQYRIQGDETNSTVDFFTPQVGSNRLHSSFQRLTSGEGMVAARGIIEAMMRWHEDVDGNFIEQFQTTGFDARIWELYLFAALSEAGFTLERPSPAPDFIARGLRGEFAVEATTVNPSQSADGLPMPSSRPESSENFATYLNHYLPTKFAGPLTAKLNKRYWTKAAVSGKPLVFAIQDFHDTMSMTYSRVGLQAYLYGHIYDREVAEDGRVSVIARPIREHQWGTKIVPSGFFSQPDSEHVSAVIFNASGTLSKFNRIGACAGFGSSEVVLIRRGLAIDPEPSATELQSFIDFVGPDYQESWIEGMEVFHNPNALHPLENEMLPGAVHHRQVEDGLLASVGPAWNPVQSHTSVLAFTQDPSTSLADPGV